MTSSLPPQTLDSFTDLLVGLHRQTTPGDQVRVLIPQMLSRAEAVDLCFGAGFVLKQRRTNAPSALHRFRTLPDTVGSGMKLLVCGLNPSPASADDGIGFARPGNRFWPAALAAGLVSRDRDPDHALHHHGMGMTDLVKRTTRRADELSAEEYTNGVERLTRMCERLRPRAIVMVGLAGWRASVAKSAKPGWQPTKVGPSPVYLMPSTSGLNASSQLADLAEHLRRAQVLEAEAP